MKILNDNENWCVVRRCTGDGDFYIRTKKPCGSRLLIEESDITLMYTIENNRCVENRYGFICPICRCFTEIHPRSIPSEVVRNARRYVDFNEDSDKSRSSDNMSGAFNKLISW